MTGFDVILISVCLVLCTFSISRSEQNESKPLLLYTTSKDIVILDTETGNKTIVYRGNSSNFFKYVDYHYSAGFIYWSDYNDGTISRVKYPSDGSAKEVVCASGYAGVGIAIDEINNHVYWLDGGHGKLYRSHLDGSNKKEIISTGLKLPRAIVLDVENEWIYFTDLALGAKKIAKCKFDGSQTQSLVKTGLYAPVGLALDLNAGRLYFSEYAMNHVMFAKLDGSDVRFVTALAQPEGIDIYGNDIYVNAFNGQMYKINKTEGYKIAYTSGSTTLLIHSDPPNMWDVKVYKRSDECSNHGKRRKEERRSPGYILDLSVHDAFSDDFLDAGWYRFLSRNGDKMSVHPPGIMSCGTYNPVWLNGSLPDVYEGNVALTVCVQNINSICEQTFTINITNCGKYYVYYLQKTPPNSSYCIGEGAVKCPNGQSSESENYPGCSSSFPNITVLPAVEALLIEDQSYKILNIPSTPSLLPVFRCTFDETPDSTYVYDVYWYIDTISVVSYKNIPYENITYTDLKGEDWIEDHTMNMEVECSIRVRYSYGSIPGPFIRSPVFKAGLFPDQYHYTVLEGGHINIAFRSTVPVGCFTSDETERSFCKQNVYVFQPYADKSVLKCSNNIASRNIVFKAQLCGLRVPSIGWNETLYLQVYGFSDGMYNVNDRLTYIRLSTTSASAPNGIWKNIQIPDIRITVTDKDKALKNRLCQSYNDPHITTVDGRSYNYMEVGEFVMYRNDNGPYWVHALFTSCGLGWQGSSCHCGIAVRSRNSLFVLRTCEQISRTEQFILQQPLTELIKCDDNDFVIENSGNDYKITLPIGTVIMFSISSWSRFIRIISIKPSVYDINVAKGLCGVPSVTKDSSDDFTHRYKGPIYDDQSFAASWRILPTMTNEQLFVAEPAFLSELYTSNLINTMRYCVCEKQASPTGSFDDFNSVNCNLIASTEYCSDQSQSSDNKVSAFYTSCPSLNRQKRSIKSLHTLVRRSTTDKDDVVDYTPLTYNYDVDNTEEVVPNTYRNGWTAEKAYETCSESIKNVFSANLFNNFVDLNEEQYIQSCVKDIELVGDTTFLADTVKAMLVFFITELKRHESLYNLKTSNGSQTILEYLTSFMCPNNCSKNGQCSLGICLCNEGYIGENCSHQISTPPSRIGIPLNGLCNLNDRECKRTNVYGDFLAQEVWYKLKYFEIRENAIHYASEEEVLQAVYRNRFMVSVDLPSTREKRSILQTVTVEGYDISFSNDRTTFGKAVTLIIYNETCYSCNASTKSCINMDICLTLISTPNTSDDKKVVAISSTIVFIVIVALFIGLLLYKSKISTKKINVVSLNIASSDKTKTKNVEMNREHTISEVDLDFENTSGTQVELFVQISSVCHNEGNHNTKHNPATESLKESK